MEANEKRKTRFINVFEYTPCYAIFVTNIPGLSPNCSEMNSFVYSLQKLIIRSYARVDNNQLHFTALSLQ